MLKTFYLLICAHGSNKIHLRQESKPNKTDIEKFILDCEKDYFDLNSEYTTVKIEKHYYLKKE